MEYDWRGIVCSGGKVNVNGFLLIGKLAHRRPRPVEGAQGFGARAGIVVIAARMDMQLGGGNGIGAYEEEREQGEEFEEAHRGGYSTKIAVIRWVFHFRTRSNVLPRPCFLR